MASPGYFSFEGIAEIIEQVREFIKDVSGRSRQERESAEIDNERKREQAKTEKWNSDFEKAEKCLRIFGYVPEASSKILGSRP